MPALSSSRALGGLDDLRDLAHPRPAVRALFAGLSSVPRVIEADEDRAVLAIWRTAAPGAEPFNGNRVATGNACVEITRGSPPVQVAVEVVACPHPLRDVSFLTSTRSWSHDADAVAETSFAAYSLGEEVRWHLFRDDDATQPRTVPRSARSIRTALEAQAASLDSSVSQVDVALTDVTRQGRLVTGRLRITAQVPDPTDASGTVTATCRYLVEADLSITSATGYENWDPVRRTSCDVLAGHG